MLSAFLLTSLADIAADSNLSDASIALILVSVTVPFALLAALAYRRSGKGEGAYTRELIMSAQIADLKSELDSARGEIRAMKQRLEEREKQLDSFRLSAARCQAAQVALMEALAALSDQVRAAGQVPALDVETLTNNMGDNVPYP